MNAYILTLIVLVVYLVLAWFLGTLLGLKSPDVWFLRGGLAFLGIVAAAVFLWYYRRQKKAEQADQADAPSGDGEIDQLVREAQAKLAASRLGRGAKLGNLPVILIAGASGSAKTSVLINSGTEAELIAGQVYQDRNILPTRAANFWFARDAVFVEAGGPVVADPGRWAKLVRRLMPGKLAAVGKSEQAPRAALVCFDCEEFMKPGAAENVAAMARGLHARLIEVSQALGINLPVYVLFTRADRLPFFLEFTGNLSNEEATQAVGASLPLPDASQAGVYAEQAAQRLTFAFYRLFVSLCDKRPDMLAREHDAARLPGIYEFPREFRKLQAPIVQFLVDLCRPSQLRSAPFLRGFYFSGVRPVVVTDMAAAPVRQPEPAIKPGSATTFFKVSSTPQPQQSFQPAAASRRVPQWVFLGHFFHDVLLADRAAMGASGASAKTSTLRRVLFASAAALALLLSAAFTVSYIGNSRLESSVVEAARGIPPSESTGANLPSVDALARLENLRQALEELTTYDREGAPLRLRWGLYKGDALLPDTRRIYFDRFRRLLLGSTETAMLDYMGKLPSTPGPGDNYGTAYDTLKAYLITTSHHDKSTRAFLAPYLLNRWSEGRGVDPQRMQLAQKQFEFYSDELKAANPFTSENDAVTIERTRRYLSQFAGMERVYQFMLAEAGRKLRPINFNRQFPGSAEVVVNTKEIAPAFTKDGYAFMDDAIKHADRFFSGEQWVLGDISAANLDRAKLEAELRSRYTNDLIAQWRAFLSASSVVRFTGIKDAARKLQILSGGQSPLLALFCVVSANTAVENADVKTAFLAPQAVVPPACQDKYLAPSNQPYMDGMLALQGSMERVAASPQGASDPAAQQTVDAAANALLATRRIAQGFPIDKAGNVPATVQKLMEDPITQVNGILKGLGPAELKGKGQGLCAELATMLRKYPFNPSSSVQATLDDLNRIFRPGDGALSQFVSQNLQNLVQKQGPVYVAKPGTMTVTPQFLGFLNRATALSDALYPSGPVPGLKYTMRSNLAGSQNVSVDLTIEGQQLANTSPNSQAKQFIWPGTTQGARLVARIGNESYPLFQQQGLWAAFQFFAAADDRGQPSSSVHTLEWRLREQRSDRTATTLTGQPISVRFDLDMLGGPPIFRRGYFSGLGCTTDVAR